MRERFCNLMQSPDANEGAPAKSDHSSYSTERTPITALLSEAKRRILLPLVAREGNLPSAEYLPGADHKPAYSCQEP